MTEKYFSQRKKDLSEILSDDFWTAWLHTIKDFAEKDYLAENFGCYCNCGNNGRYNEERIQEKIFTELGDVRFECFKTNYTLSQDNKFDLIEFFFRFISKPMDYSNHCPFWNGQHPISFDTNKGRYEYTIEIKKLFERFNHPYELVKGQIRLTTSPILDKPILSLELNTNDAHLKKLIETAVLNFYDRSGSKKQIALRSIVDAYDRLKTLEIKTTKDKKKSVEKILEKISSIEYVKSSLNNDMKELTEIANNFCIRHHEMTKKKIDDHDLIDFLFYAYFNFVRLILNKYGMIKKNKKSEDHEIPF